MIGVGFCGLEVWLEVFELGNCFREVVLGGFGMYWGRFIFWVES